VVRLPFQATFGAGISVGKQQNLTEDIVVNSCGYFLSSIPARAPTFASVGAVPPISYSNIRQPIPSSRSFAISPRIPREVARSFGPPHQRAQGMPDARCVRSRACGVESTRVSHHGHTGNTRHSPRNGFNGFLRALPGDRALLPPSPAALAAGLTPASGRQDHTTSPSALALFVKSASASTASRSALMTLANAPLSARDGASQCH
jgi:hypothetical protein